MGTVKPYPPKEKDVQRGAKTLLSLYGFNVSDMSQGYRPGGGRHSTTRQTKGVPDLYCQHKTLPVRLWIECKSPTGKVSKDQSRWHENERQAGGIVLVVHSVDELAEWLAQKMREWRRWRNSQRKAEQHGE